MGSESMFSLFDAVGHQEAFGISAVVTAHVFLIPLV